MSRFPTAGHLCSWAKFSPGIYTSAGKSKGNGSTGHGNRYLAGVLGEAAVVAGRTDTFLGERYRRIAKRRGKKRAIVAVGRSILVIVWHLLAGEDADVHTISAPITSPATSTQSQETQPHPPTRSPRLHRHPQPRRLTHTTAATTCTRP